MKTKLSIILILICGIVVSQNIQYAYDSKEIEAIVKGPVYIIPTGDDAFDDSLKNAMQKYWKISTWKALSQGEIEEYLGNEDNYFIVPMDGFNTETKSSSTIASPRKNEKAYELSIIHGGKHNKKLEMKYQFTVAHCNIPFFGTKFVIYGLSFAVKNLNDNVQYVIEKKFDPIIHISGAPKTDIPKNINKGAGVLKTKTLLIDERWVKFGHVSENVLKTYKYKYKILPVEEVTALIYSPEGKDYCFYEMGLQIYDVQTRSKVFSYISTGFGGSFKTSKKELAELNAAVAAGK